MTLDDLKVLTSSDIDTDQTITRLVRENAVIPKAKLTKYALDPESKDGKHKARVFNAFMNMTGPNGKTAWVRTGWIVKPKSDKFSLSTVYVDLDYERKRQK